MTIYDLSDKMQKVANWLTDEQANKLEGEKTKKKECKSCIPQS